MKNHNIITKNLHDIPDYIHLRFNLNPYNYLYSKQEYSYCNKCNIHILKKFFNNGYEYYYFLNKKEVYKEIKYSKLENLPFCEEIIIKNIIE